LQAPDHAAPAAVQERAEADEGGRGGAGELDAFGWGSIVLGGPLDPGDEWERRLAVGAQIACRLRGAVRQQLGAPLAGLKSWEHGSRERLRVSLTDRQERLLGAGAHAGHVRGTCGPSAIPPPRITGCHGTVTQL
jgi:hypothetical protein